MKKLLLVLALLSPSAFGATDKVTAQPAGVTHSTAQTTCANVQTASWGTVVGETPIIVLSLPVNSATAVASVADNATGGTNTYTSIVANNPTGGHVELWYSSKIARVNASGLVVTATFASQKNSCTFISYTGVIVTGATNSAAGGASATPLITTTTTSANSWAVAGMGDAVSTATWSAATGNLRTSVAGGSTTTPGAAIVDSGVNAAQGTVATTSATLSVSNKTWAVASLELRSDLALPTISPDGGSFTDDTGFTISDSDAGVTFCFTLGDGTQAAPTASTPGTCATGTSSASGTAIATGNIVKYLVTKAAWANSATVTSGAFTLTVATPTFGTNGGSFANDTTSTMATTTASGVIHYTNDGTTPTTGSTLYSGAVTVNATGTVLKVIGNKTNYVNSAVATSSAFTLTVGAASCSPAGGSFSGTQSVTCSLATTTGATTKYCQDSPGTCTPTTTYTGAVSQASSGHFRVQGSKLNYVSDPVVDYSFTIGSISVGLSTSSHDYGTITNLTNSSAFDITLTNSGGASATLSGEAIGGTNSGDFTISGNTCTGTLAAGGTCVVSVVFNPGSQGSRSGTLTVTSNDPVNPSQVVTLTGTGAWPAAAQCTVGVAFTPSVSVARSGTLTFADDASPATQVATLTGTGGGPPSTLGTLTANFASISPGRSVILSWTASGDTDLACSIDQGVGALTISDPNGSSGTKTVSPTTPGPITYTMSCTSTSGSVSPTATVTVTRPSAGPF